MIETLWQDIRFGLRMLAKTPGFTAVAVLTLALGIGANTAIFTVLNAVLLNPLPVRDISRLVELDTTDRKTMVTAPNFIRLGMSYPNYQDYAKQRDVFMGLAAFDFANLTLSGRGEPKQFPALLVSANYFDVLGVRPLLGRTFYSDEDTKPGGNAVAVLSYSLWAREFGSDSGLIGRTITLNAQPYTVIGVTPRGFKGTLSLAPADEIWIPLSMHHQALSGPLEQFFNERRFLGTDCFGRLQPGISMRQAESALQTVASRLERAYPEDNAGRSVALASLADAAVGINQRDQIVLAGGVLMDAVGLVLLITCVNLANLLLAQAAKREKEMSVRAALGAGRARLLRQSLTESVVLSLLGGAAGLVVAYWGRSLLWSFRPSFVAPNDMDLPLDARVLLFTLAIAVLTGLLFGIVPAIKVSRPDINEALKVGGRSGTIGWGRNRLRSLLVVTEISLAMMALIGAGLFVRSMQFADRIDPGFESRKLFVFNFDLGSQHYDPGRGQQFYRDAIERAASVPGVQSAAVAANPPMGGGFLRTVFLEGQDESAGQRGTLTNTDAISPGFFRTVGIPLLRGRIFTDLDRDNTMPVAIVNRAMAEHFWPNEDPIGKRFRFFGEATLRQVIGEVGNTVVFQIGEPPQPVVYLPLAQNYSPAATLQVRTTGRPESVLAAVRSQVQSLDKNLALTNVFTIRQLLGQALWAPRMGAGLLSLFGGISLVLAVVGIYGVLSYSVSQQTHEIGIRMALGADPWHVLRHVVGQGLRLSLAGTGAGVMASLAVFRVLSSLLFGISAADPVTFFAVVPFLMAVALLASYVPARRAMGVDPVKALSYE